MRVIENVNKILVLCDTYIVKVCVCMGKRDYIPIDR